MQILTRYFLFVLFTLTVVAADAQKGLNQIGLGAEVAVPLGEFGKAANTGFGGWAKFLYGVGASDQVSFTTGYTSLSLKKDGSELTGSGRIAILPFLLGFRHFLNNFFIEPQLGFASYNAKVTFLGESVSGNRDALTYAAGIGYVADKLELGVRYQSATIEGESYNNVAFRIGYNFALKNKSKK